MVLTCLWLFYKLLVFEIKWRDEILLCLVGGMYLGAGAKQEEMGGGSFAGRGLWAMGTTMKGAQHFVQPQNITSSVVCSGVCSAGAGKLYPVQGWCLARRDVQKLESIC